MIPAKGWYTKEDVLRVLSKRPPILQVQDDATIRVIPDIPEEDATLWTMNLVHNTTVFENIALVPIRNRLTSELVCWNNKKEKKQYGIYRTAQYSHGFHVQPRLTSVDSTQEFYIELNLDPIQMDPTVVVKAMEWNLGLLSLARGNHAYEKLNEFSNPGRYTSFSVAWGVLDSPKLIKSISPYSIPIIVERGLYALKNEGTLIECNEEKGISEDMILITKETNNEYYPKECVFVTLNNK